MKNKVTVIEMTPTFIRLLCGYTLNNNVYVLQALEGEDFTLEEGLPVVREAADSLRLLIENAKKTLNETDIGPFILALPPYRFAASESFSTTATADTNSVLSLNDYKNCINRAMKEKKTHDNTAIYCAPFRFSTDNNDALFQYPEQCLTNAFAIYADVHTIDSTYYKRYKEILNKAQVEPYLEIVSTYGSSYFIDSFRPNMSHYLLLDLEKEYSYLSYVDSGRLKLSVPLKENINNVLQVSSQTLHIPVKKVEELMQIYGFFSTPGFDYYMENGLSLKDTSSCFMASFRPIAMEVQEMIQRYDISLEVPLIIYGAGAQIEELSGLFMKLLSRNCSTFEPHIFGAQGGSYDNCLGAILLSSLPYQKAEDYRSKEYNEFHLHGSGFDR